MNERLRLIGYWRNNQHPEYPDPADLVDESWDEGERHNVWWYVVGGTHTVAAMGVSPCRLCGKPNGSGELTDGTFAWPEGLAHYVYDHSVRLPAAFVQHALSRLAEFEQRGSDLTWWLNTVG